MLQLIIFYVGAVQKFVKLVDLVKSFHTSIQLQKSASLQPRTGLSEFGGDLLHSIIRLLIHASLVEAAAGVRRIEKGRAGSDGGSVRLARDEGRARMGPMRIPQIGLRVNFYYVYHA